MDSQKGYDEQEGFNTKKLRRDTRSLPVQITDFYSDTTNCDLCLILTIIFCFIFPSYYVLFTINLFLTPALHIFLSRRNVLPMEYPASHASKDYHNKLPGGKNRYGKGEGRYYLGNSVTDKSELWSSFKRFINHTLAFGATGSGKTEYLISIAFNGLVTGSGFFYIDPKSGKDLYPKLYTISRRFSRDDDIRILAFHIKKTKKSSEKITNTINIVKTGTAHELANMFISLAPSESGSKNLVFYQKGQNLIRSFLFCWVEQRDLGLIESSIDSIRCGLSLENCIDLTQDMRISEPSRKSLLTFINSLGHQSGNKASDTVAEQYGFAISYFSNTLNLIADSYGHMFDNSAGETSIKDCIIRKRIVIGAIPSLGLSDAEVKNLGQILLSRIRLSIGDCIDPIQSHVFKKNKKETKTPLPIIIDEYAAIGVPDFITTITQARFLDIGAIIGAQDLAGIKRIDPYGAEQLIENTRFKAFFRIETGKDTFKLAKEIAGDITVLETTGYEVKKEGIGTTYYDKPSVSKATRSRINLQDLIAQTEGEFHGLYNGKLFRGTAFYIDIEPNHNTVIRIQHLIQPIIAPKKIEQNQQATNSIQAYPTKDTVITDESLRQDIYDELVVAWEIGHDQEKANELKGYINEL